MSFPAKIGHYYAKVLPTQAGFNSAFFDSSALSHGRRGSGISISGSNASSSAASRKDAGIAVLQSAKAWEVGQRAARHFLAARAYFMPLERGPSSVIVALDLCDLYLYLANMGATVATTTPVDGSDSPYSGSTSGNTEQGEGGITVPVPSPPGAGVGSILEGNQLRPAAAVRYQCLEGALRSLLDTRLVFVGMGVGNPEIDSASRVFGMTGVTTATTSAAGQRLRRLLEMVIERLPKVLQALVRVSMAAKASPPLSGVSAAASDSQPSVTGIKSPTDCRSQISTTFKSMYRRSLMGLRGGGEGAQAMLAGLAAEYGGIAGGNQSVAS